MTATARGRAILAIIAATFVYAAAAACVKALEGGVPLAQVVLFRSLFALPLLLVLMHRAGGWRLLRTRNPRIHALRTLFGLVGMATAFYGYATLPLAGVTALGFTMPLFLTLLAVPLLGERVDAARAAAVAVGFVGVLIMVQPWQAEGAYPPIPVLIVLVGALAWALAMITIRQMGAAGEAGVTIVLWFALGCSAVALVWALPGWRWPSAAQWILLAAVGLLSAVAQLLMTEGYRRADPTLLAPFEYAGIVWTTALGALLWSELPDGWDAAGIAVLVASGLFIWRREVTARP
ncbi:MAG: DMT family transporter [Acetobacteraceae bacterium]|nr:DMT family transporter [Acetobacteraceae bacterium]